MRFLLSKVSVVLCSRSKNRCPFLSAWKRHKIARKEVSNQSHKKGSFFKHNKCLIITLTMNLADESVRIGKKETTTNNDGSSARNEKMCLAVNNEETIDWIRKTSSFCLKPKKKRKKFIILRRNLSSEFLGLFETEGGFWVICSFSWKKIQHLWFFMSLTEKTLFFRLRNFKLKLETWWTFHKFSIVFYIFLLTSSSEVRFFSLFLNQRKILFRSRRGHCEILFKFLKELW